MVNKELLKIILSKKKTTQQAVYEAFQRVRKKYRNLISKEEAAFIYAIENGIDVHKYLKNDPELLHKVMDIVNGKHQVTETEKKVKNSSSKSPAQKVLKVNGFIVSDILLPPRIMDDAKKMAEIYPMIYIFENSIRNFLKLALNKKYQNLWWTKERMTNNPFTKANSRKDEEGKNLWHGKRGQGSMLDYVDFDELEAIINHNTETLMPYFKDLPKKLDWLMLKIKEIYPSRNVLAHNNPLSKDDIARVKVICNDWNKQLPLLKQKLHE